MYGLEHGVDDPQAGGPQGPPRLGDLNDGVGDLRDLGLGGTVRQADFGLDAVGRQEAPGETRVLGDTRTPAGSSATRPRRGVLAHRQDHPDRTGAGLAVAQLTQRRHLRLGLLDPIPAGDAQVEQTLRDVLRDLLRAQDPALRRPGGRRWWPDSPRPSPLHRQIGGLEEVQGGPFK